MTGQPFTPRQESQFLRRILVFINHNLTLIAFVVAFIGVVLLVIGPGRTMISGASDGSSRVTEAITADEGSGGILLASGGQISAGVPSGEGLLNRGLVPYTVIPDRPRDEIVTYTVQSGDTLEGIARRFNIDRNTVFWANSDTLRGDVHMLQQGLDLYILPTDGVYHKADGAMSLQQIADKYSADVNAINSAR